MNRAVRRSLLVPLLMLGISACGSPLPGRDGAADGDRIDATQSDAGDVSGDVASDGSVACRTDIECSDAVFCNGAERCMPGAPGANARGCIPSPAPACLATQMCNEALARCDARCSVAEDADGDGHRAAACGGDDCDDSDAQRYPGNTETCDSMHDEDCNPLTIGARDADGDGEIDAMCCNRAPGSIAACGPDCDDSNAGVHPGVPEVCNGIDDNCNAQIDENVTRLFFPDTDGDGYGQRDASPVSACSLAAGMAENSLDCDDTSSAVSPVADETCNGVDDNCDGRTDESPAAASHCAETYGSPANTRFACTAATCSVNCSTDYADCDTRLDNGCEVNLQNDIDHCGACATWCGLGSVCNSGRCERVVQVSAGPNYSCALRSNGIVLCWGANDVGQLGDGSGVTRLTPVIVPGLGGVNYVATSHSEIALMPYQSCPATCAVHGNSVVCWGCNGSGQVGIGRTGGIVAQPGDTMVGIPTLDVRYGTGNVMPSAAVGASFACAAQSGPGPGAGGAYCAGLGNYGQVTGSGTMGTPSRVAGGIEITRVTAGVSHGCYIAGGTASAPRGRAWCWGENYAGQCGATPSMTTPEFALTMPAGVGDFSVVQIEAGYHATCARAGTGGQVFCWGENVDGQLGNGNNTNTNVPSAVLGITDATDVALGGRHGCVVRATGSVMCWGSNRFGQLGNGTTTSSNRPVTVTGISDAIDVSTSDYHTCVVRSNGRVVCFGRNDRGQLGDGTTVERHVPVEVAGL